jgi:hypothetical protein
VSLIVDEHRQYLSDPARLAVFRRAIREVVRPGAVVADIGSGTGILGLFALEAGAARVYSIEASGMLEIATRIAAANGFASRFHPLRRHSSEARLPEPVDLFVSDFIGRIGFDAGILEIYPDAVPRLLRPGGLLLPSSMSIWLAPVEREDASEQVHFWQTPRAGFDVSSAFQWAANTGYPLTFLPRDLLADATEALTLPTGESPAPVLRAEFDVVTTRTGTVHGLGGWASARLSPSVTLTNSPLDGERISRRNVFFPISRPIPVLAGDTLRLRFSLRAADQVVSWSVQGPAREGGRDRQTHSTLKGMLFGSDDLRRSRPDFVPVLTARGRGRRTILELCDGRRSLHEVEELVFARHGELFRSRTEAAVFVAEVIAGYAEV